jgi:prepilin-type N-terminal cleavage/methylation domain-containing protein
MTSAVGIWTCTLFLGVRASRPQKNSPEAKGGRDGRAPRKVSHVSARGFSALELIVAMGVAGIFSGVLYAFYHFHAQVLRVQEVKLSLREGSRLALDFLAREIPLAGARPVRGSACEGFERLTEATAQRIVLQYDYRGSGVGSPPDGCPDDPNERIVYTYEGGTSLLRRGTGGGPPQPFIGDVPPDGFLLRYFDRDGNELSPAHGDTTRDRGLSRRHRPDKQTSPGPDRNRTARLGIDFGYFSS